MSWVGLRDATDGGLCLPEPVLQTVLPQGTLAIDFRHHPSDRPVNILRHARRDPVAAVVTLRSDPDGTLSLLLRQGDHDALHCLPLPPLLPSEPVSVHYLWDSLRGTGAFAAHLPERGLTELCEIAQPLPLTWQDAALILTDRAGCRTAPGFCHAAIADHLATIGPQPGIDGAGLVETPDGPRPLHLLRAGDPVIAADGAPAVVRWAGSADLPCPASGTGHHRPHRMRAPYFGVGSDLLVAGGAVLRLCGSEVEYLFGEAEVAVAVRHLADGQAILPLSGGPEPRFRRWHHLVLDRAVPLLVSGAVIEGLDSDALRARPALHRWSILAGLPAEQMPAPAARSCPQLRDYEAQTLRRMRAA
jgi:hypothetical protein